MNKQSNVIFWFLLLVIIASWVLFIYQPKEKPPAAPQLAATPTNPAIGVRTKITGCVVQGPFPDKACTPGAIFTEATADKICVPGYTKTVRYVPVDLKREVYAEYGIFHHERGEYEVDHFVPLELGGSNDIANLFPEAAEPRPGFHEKDKVENYLHQEVCAGRMPLAEAQRKIADNWLEVYNQIQ